MVTKVLRQDHDHVLYKLAAVLKRTCTTSGITEGDHCYVVAYGTVARYATLHAHSEPNEVHARPYSWIKVQHTLNLHIANTTRHIQVPRPSDVASSIGQMQL